MYFTINMMRIFMLVMALALSMVTCQSTHYTVPQEMYHSHCMHMCVDGRVLGDV